VLEAVALSDQVSRLRLLALRPTRLHDHAPTGDNARNLIFRRSGFIDAHRTAPIPATGPATPAPRRTEKRLARDRRSPVTGRFAVGLAAEWLTRGAANRSMNPERREIGFRAAFPAEAVPPPVQR
jgi:hypothetical protein